MSDNYRFYADKVAESRSHNDSGALADQLRDILETVRWCEGMWALEDRMDQALGLDHRRDA